MLLFGGNLVQGAQGICLKSCAKFPPNRTLCAPEMQSDSSPSVVNFNIRTLLVTFMRLIQYVWVGSVYFGFSLRIAYLIIEKQIHN